MYNIARLPNFTIKDLGTERDALDEEPANENTEHQENTHGTHSEAAELMLTRLEYSSNHIFCLTERIQWPFCSLIFGFQNCKFF